MPRFNYVALDTKGKEVTGEVESDTSTNAISRIREMGYFPTNVAEARKPGGKAAPPQPGAKTAKKGISLNFQIPGFGSGVKSKVLTAFTRQLATLIDAGLPLLRGLNVLRNQERNPVLKKTLGQLSEAVEAGSTFSEALAQHPKIYNKLYVNMVRAGEAGGVLDVTLNRLADFMEKAQRIKNKVISAMVYPSVVILVAMGILFFLMTVIVPKFEQIFSDLLGTGEKLPALTRGVMAVSQFVSQRFHYVLIAVALFVILLKALAKTDQGRFVLDKLKLNAPLVGGLIRKVSIARFTRTLGTLIASGVPILQALNIVRETSGNAVVAKAVNHIHDSVKEGERIVQPLEASGIFPPMVVSMVDVGEETGALPDMLMKIADVYDDEVDNAVGALTSLLEPIMIVVLAFIVGTIVIALFLPLIEIMGRMGQ